jgi:organic radical activating enzyme
MNKYFPIKTETACKLKWGWSTLYLNSGITASCHRSSFSKLTPEYFNQFHNTPTKVQARDIMLDGKWPGDGCEYCQGIEKLGGTSDRMLQNSIPGLFPEQQGSITGPVILEVYFNNTCNLSCLYCNPGLSSSIDQEYRKFGNFTVGGVKLEQLAQKHIQDLEEPFWNWAADNFNKLERFHFLGGEPFYQKQLDKFLDFIDNSPNPNCEFCIVTNLMIPLPMLQSKINKIKNILAQRKLKRFDITVSIDCWGDAQEYVRYGLDLTTWTTNFEYLLSQKWIKLNINQTISALTVKTMPELIRRLTEWRRVRSVGHYFSVTEPGPSYMRPNIFGTGVFDKDFELVLQLMPTDSEDDRRAYQYMSGIANEIKMSKINQIEINNLMVFLNEKDRRRNTDWRTTFPWLKEYVV